MAVDPSLVNFAMSAPGTSSIRRSAHSTSSAEGRKVRASGQLLNRGFHDSWKAMAQRHRAQSHSVFDKLVAVDVPYMAARASRDEAWREERVLIVALRVGMRSAWDRSPRSKPQLS